MKKTVVDIIIKALKKADLGGFEPPASGSEVPRHSRLDHRTILYYLIFLINKYYL